MSHVLVAYLDPGSGSMLLQMLLGGIAGLAVTLKLFGKRVFSFLAFWKRGESRRGESRTPAPGSDAERS